MRKVTVLSKDAAIKYIPNTNAAVIRVLEPYEEYYALAGEYSKEIMLRFHDVVPSPSMPSNTVYFSREMADDLIKEFKSLTGCSEVVVHCHAGVSRSPAIALGLAWFLGDTTMEDSIKSLRIVPNPLVMSVIASQLGIKEEKSDYILRYTNNDKEDRISSYIEEEY